MSRRLLNLYALTCGFVLSFSVSYPADSSQPRSPFTIDGYSCLTPHFRNGEEVMVAVRLGADKTATEIDDANKCTYSGLNFSYLINVQSNVNISAIECQSDYAKCSSVLLTNDSGRRFSSIESRYKNNDGSEIVRSQEIIAHYPFLSQIIQSNDELFVRMGTVTGYRRESGSLRTMYDCNVSTPRKVCTIQTNQYNKNILIQYSIEPHYIKNPFALGRRIFTALKPVIVH